MSSFSDLNKIVSFAQGLNSNKIIVGTSNRGNSQFNGTYIDLDNYYIYSLCPSNGGTGIKND